VSLFADPLLYRGDPRLQRDTSVAGSRALGTVFQFSTFEANRTKPMVRYMRSGRGVALVASARYNPEIRAAGNR